MRDLLGEVGDAVLRAPVHTTVPVPPAEITVPSTVVPAGQQRALSGNCTWTFHRTSPGHCSSCFPTQNVTLLNFLPRLADAD